MTWFEREKVVALDPNLSPIDYLLARMRDPRTEENVRTRIAIALLPFTTPKLGITAQVSETDFATMLDARIKRHQSKLIEYQRPQKIDVKPSTPGRLRRRI